MRILVLTTEYEPTIIGGLGVVASQLAAQLSTFEHEVVIVTKGIKQSIDDRRIGRMRVIRVPKCVKHDVVPYLKKRVLPIDMIHVHSIQWDEVAIALKELCKVRTLYTCHSLITLEKFQSKFAKTMQERQQQLLRHCDVVVSPSLWQKDQIDTMHLTSKSVVIPNGVTLSPIAPLDANKRDLVFVGRLVRLKGIEDLLAALATYPQKHPVSLDVYGRGENHYEAKLLRMANNIRPHRVHFRGFLDHERMTQRMRSYGALIMPSKNESFGLSALEAMGSGIPVCASRQGGLAEFVDRSVAAVIDPISPKTIRESLDELFHDKEKTAQRRMAAHERAKQYAWNLIAKRYEKLMEEIR